VKPLQAKPKEMVRAEPTNNRTAGIDIHGDLTQNRLYAFGGLTQNRLYAFV